MNLLLITPYIPYPLSEGGKISQFAMIDYLRHHQSITLILVANDEESINNISQLQSLWPEVDIKTINTYVIVNEKKTIKKYVLNKLRSFKDLFKTTIKFDPPSSDFDNHGLFTFAYPKSRIFIKQLLNIIHSKEYDLVQIDLLDYIDLVHLIPDHIKKVFVHHEIRFARLESGSSKNDDKFESYIKSYVKNIEGVILKNFDGIMVFSESDKLKLEKFPALVGKVFNSPFPILDKDFSDLNNIDTKVDKLVFVGGDGHLPNIDAVDWYASDIYPMIKNFTDLKLHVIGRWSIENQQVISKKCNNNVYFAGFVDNLKTYCKNSIMLVPVRIGSGIRTKILYAMAHGTPIISTSIGCEGIELIDDDSIAIANTSNEFKDSILKLSNNLQALECMSKNAQKIAKTKYSQQAAGELRNKILQEITFAN